MDESPSLFDQLSQDELDEPIPTVEGGCPPPEGWTSWQAYWDDYDTVAHDDRRESLWIGKAMALAPNLQVFVALLEGQDVPADALDQRWRRRYRL